MVEGTNRKNVKDIASALTAVRQDDLRARASAVAQSRARGAIPATLGVGFEKATAAGSAEAGAVGDLVEQNAGTRTFFSVPRQIASTDGVFEIEIRDLKTIDLEDEAGDVTVFGFAQPS